MSDKNKYSGEALLLGVWGLESLNLPLERTIIQERGPTKYLLSLAYTFKADLVPDSAVGILLDEVLSEIYYEKASFDYKLLRDNIVVKDTDDCGNDIFYIEFKSCSLCKALVQVDELLAELHAELVESGELSEEEEKAPTCLSLGEQYRMFI